MFAIIGIVEPATTIMLSGEDSTTNSVCMPASYNAPSSSLKNTPPAGGVDSKSKTTSISYTPEPTPRGISKLRLYSPVVSLIHPEANLLTMGGAGEPSGESGKSEGTSSRTTTEELLPRIGVSWKMSLANPETQFVEPLGVQSNPNCTVAFA